ncbi:MAG: L-threonylcarbamoyladenylate synthase [Candidatus Micrarchaeia archaeon]
MRLIVCPPLKNAVAISCATLKAEGVICYPTDTLYGLGADATNADACKKISDIKKRGKNPYSVMFSDWKMAQEYVRLDESVKKMLEKITPGPFTFLLPAKKNLSASSSHLLGCRVPDNEFCLQICKKFGYPIVSTSANVSGEREATCAQEIDIDILNKVDLIVDGGRCEYSLGSTIIDVPAKKILRKGVGFETAQKWLEKI